jgi:monoamine oxidase
VGAIEFDPPLEAKHEPLARLAMGMVARVTLRLSTRFWASDAYAKRVGADELHTMSFLQSADPAFPTWWTHYPATTPLIVAWQGGPRARSLIERGRGVVEREAVAALARQFHLTRANATRLVEGVWFHDWMHDAFARGAYSYQKVGGSDAPAALARPIGGTLFFAGEATDEEGRNGTVHGAIATGRRAARQVVRALARAR